MDTPSTSFSTDDGDVNFCRICTSNTHERVVLVGLKGKETLKKSSAARHDNLFTDLDLKEKIFVHSTCRSNYINKINVEAAKRKVQTLSNEKMSPVKRKLRKSRLNLSVDNEDVKDEDYFNWDENCLICGTEASITKQKKKPADRRKSISQVENSNFVSNIVELLNPFTDDHNREILKRIRGARNLVTLKAKYHKDCYARLQSAYSERMKTSMKCTDKIDQVMEEIYDFIQSSDECQFTMAQLKEAIKQSDTIPSEPTIKSRLISKYSDQVNFSSRMGGNTYICFSNHLYDIFTDAWYNTRSNNIEEEEIKLIDSAAELIRRKIRNTVSNIHEYPASDSILTNANDNIHPLLLRFLNNVIYKDKKKLLTMKKRIQLKYQL